MAATVRDTSRENREGMNNMTLLHTVRTLRSNARAFTLIELLVVIAIIALLVGILLPALAEARKSGQAARSAANLSGLGKAFYIYANDYKDVWVNPYQRDAAGHPQEPGRWDVFDIPEKNLIFAAAADGNRVSEGLAFVWNTLISGYMGDKSVNSGDWAVSPSDQVAMDRFRTIVASNNLDGDGSFMQPDTSYLYSPVFWTAPERYTSATTLPALGDATSARRLMRHNRIDSVPFISQKVLCFERGDFTRKNRARYVANAVAGREPISPSWLNPEASPQVLLVDGSVQRVSMSGLYRVAVTGTDVDAKALYEPTSTWNPTDFMLPDVNSGVADQIWEARRGLKQFFWATRNGVRGVDIPRTK